jgi:hypothetical protein
MRTNAWLTMAAVLVVGFGVAIWPQGGRRVTDPKVGSSAQSHEVPSPREAIEVELLRAEVATLGDQLRARSPAAAASTAPEAPPADAALERDPAPTLPQAVSEPAALQASYDAAFDRELADAGWARNEERAIVGFFDTDAAQGARLERVECRESMCRMRIQFQDPAAHQRFLVNLGSPPFDHGGFHRTDETSGALTLYTAREGRSMPTFEADDARSASR